MLHVQVANIDLSVSDCKPNNPIIGLLLLTTTELEPEPPVEPEEPPVEPEEPALVVLPDIINFCPTYIK